MLCIVLLLEEELQNLTVGGSTREPLCIIRPEQYKYPHGVV